MALRFLNFPAEIRDRVYANLLCPDPLGQLTEAEKRRWPTVITHLFHTSILLTCRQVYQEARAVMVRRNEFVCIALRGLNIAHILSRVHVHIVVVTPNVITWPVVRDFRGATMMYRVVNQDIIDEEGLQEYNTCDLLILGRDLDAFVRDLSDPAVGGYQMAADEHLIGIMDPFRKSADPSYNTLATQKRLLQPFRDHYHGYLRVQITGKVDRALAASVVEEVRREAVPDAAELFASLRELKDQGNALFRAGEFFEAGERWFTATARLRRLSSGHNWPRVKSMYGAGVVDEMAELLFTLYSNQAQAVLSEMRGLDPDDEPGMDDARSRVEGSCRAAYMASSALGAGWTPSARQRAKLLYKAAQAARLAGDLLEAQVLINEARNHQPGDPEIRRDVDEITRLSMLLLDHLM